MSSWLVPANTKFYDVFAAFARGESYWPMNAKYQVDDTAYIYLAAPQKQIGFVCVVLRVGLDLEAVADHVAPFVKGTKPADKGTKKFMELKVISTLPIVDGHPLALRNLRQNGLNGMLMGARKLENNPLLFRYIKECPT